MRSLTARLFAVFGTALFLTICFAGASGATSGPLWTLQMGTASADLAKCVAVDGSGNVYVAGWTSGDLDGNTSAGGYDLFVVKYDTNGVKQWTRQLGASSSDDGAQGVALDASGNVYVAGWTHGDLDGNTNAGSADLFVVKYDTNGNKQWTRQLGSASDDWANGIAVDAGGNVYAAGYTSGGLDGNTYAGIIDLFVVKYDTNGNKQWTRQLGTSDIDGAKSVALDASGNVYVAGWTRSDLDGNTSAGYNDLFVVKYDTNGVKQWTKQLGTSDYDCAQSVSVDTNGNVYAAGGTTGDLDGNTSAGSYDLFVVKYDTDGVKQWTQQMGNSASEQASGVAVDASGNVYATGYTDGGLDGNTNAGSYDLFVVKFDTDGVKQWTKQMGTATTEEANGVAVDTSGNVYAAGYTYGGIDGNTNADPTGNTSDLFVMKLDGAPPTSTITAPVDGSSVGGGTTYNITGTADGTGSGVQTVEVGIALNGGPADWYAAWPTSATDWSYTWTLPADGTSCTIQSRATDWAGNVETPGSGVTVTVDNTVPATNASLAEGSYLSKQWVTLTASETATIYYTTDGTTPTTSSPTYGSPILLSASATLKYFAKDSAGNSESVNSASYTINPCTEWTGQMGTGTDDFANSVAVDAGGNVYVAGYTYGGLDGNTNAGSCDLFVVKYDTGGNKQWTKQLGTSTYDRANGVAVDAGGNVYVAGFTYGDLDGNTNAGSYDLFVVKYDTNGNKQWTKQMGTTTYDRANGVAVDAGGNVYAAGFTYGGLDGNTNAGSCDLFVVKYDTNGVKQWTTQLGSAYGDEAYGVAVDAGGNVYAAGSTWGGLDGNISAGNGDTFVAKFDTNGVKQWTRQMGTASDDVVTGVSVDAGGNVYAAGYTQGGLDGNTNAGGYDLFVVKYDTDGVKQWTRELGTASDDKAWGIAVYGGNVYAAGFTLGDLDGNTSAGYYDLFVAKYDTNGVKQWTKQMGTANGDLALGVAVDTGGNVYAAGYTDGGLDGNTNAGGDDLFVMKLAQPASSATLTPSASTASSGTQVTFTAGAFGGSGSYEYKFYHYGPATGNAWAAQTSYAASNTWDWTPSSSDAGDNWFYVRARNAGSTAEWEAWGQCAVAVKTPPTSVSLARLPSKRVYFAGKPVTFTATASGGSGPYEYLFVLYGPASNGVLKAAYSTTNTWTWTPTSSDRGANTVVVWVRNTGSSASYEKYGVAVVNVR